MAKTPITTHYNYTDSKTLMVMTVGNMCTLQLLSSTLNRLLEQGRCFVLD